MADSLLGMGGLIAQRVALSFSPFALQMMNEYPRELSRNGEKDYIKSHHLRLQKWLFCTAMTEVFTFGVRIWAVGG